nr:hypothetical protein Itr_chr05CG18430 [Ipomoea trifida]
MSRINTGTSSHGNQNSRIFQASSTRLHGNPIKMKTKHKHKFFIKTKPFRRIINHRYKIPKSNLYPKIKTFQPIINPHKMEDDSNSNKMKKF